MNTASHILSRISRRFNIKSCCEELTSIQSKNLALSSCRPLLYASNPLRRHDFRSRSHSHTTFLRLQHSAARTMATATTLDEATLEVLERSYPAVKSELTPAADPAKLSSAIFPSANYTESEKAELTQWLITASHLDSHTSEDSAKRAERLSHLNTHLSSRTTVLGSKPSLADIALYIKLSQSVSSWTDDERTGENGHHHIVRFVDFVQNAPAFGLKLSTAGEKVKIDPDDVKVKIKPLDPKAEKERKKKAAAAAAAAAAGASGATETSLTADKGEADGKKASKKDKLKGKVEHVGEAIASAVKKEVPLANASSSTSDPKPKKEKKPKQPKQPAPPASSKDQPLSPSLIDLRVGHILKAERHPNADSLYVSTIAVGDAPDADHTSVHDGVTVRTVCSGLNGLIPLDAMQNRLVVCVCNLKPVIMRGIKSAAMVLAASPRLSPDASAEDAHKGPVELVVPPAGARAGDKVFFDGWSGDPEKVLNPKKKVWESIQQGFTTTQGLQVAFDVAAVEQLKGAAKPDSGEEQLAKLKTHAGGVCTVETLKGAVVR